MRRVMNWQSAERSLSLSLSHLHSCTRKQRPIRKLHANNKSPQGYAATSRVPCDSHVWQLVGPFTLPRAAGALLSVTKNFHRWNNDCTDWQRPSSSIQVYDSVYPAVKHDMQVYSCNLENPFQIKNMSHHQWRPRLKRLNRGSRKLQFSDRLVQVSDRADRGVQNFNFAPKFPQIGKLPAPNFEFLENNFRTG